MNTSPKDDGGHAFPDTINDGMTLRDYFAAKALASGMVKIAMTEYELVALFGRNRTGITREEMMAADAYRIADAMLKARKP